MQDDILDLAYEVSRVTEEKVGIIEGVMQRTKVLALNARLEAARAGVAGAAFGVVAQEVGAISQEIRSVAQELRKAVATNLELLGSAGEQMMIDFRGMRFADLARTAVEMLDRNLYERSCDVRWWATDSAIVDALMDGSAEKCRHACDRLATILRSYTVYLDLWVVDLNGRVVANGRSDRYPHVIGQNVRAEPWFDRALNTADGGAFHVSDIERNAILGNALTATYSTAVRKDAGTNGEPIGALIIFFDWGPQAMDVVEGISLRQSEQHASRIMILDSRHRVIAASDGRGILSECYPLNIRDDRQGYYQTDTRVVAYSLTPGYETYQGLGWYGCIESDAALSGGRSPSSGRDRAPMAA